MDMEQVFPDLGPGDALRGARELRGLTQAALAQALGMRAAHVSDRERGRRPIGREMDRKLGAALDFPYKAFL